MSLVQNLVSLFDDLLSDERQEEWAELQQVIFKHLLYKLLYKKGGGTFSISWLYNRTVQLCNILELSHRSTSH